MQSIPFSCQKNLRLRRFAGFSDFSTIHSEPKKTSVRMHAGKEKAVEAERFAGVGLRELYEQYMPQVYRTAIGYTRNHHDAEDVTQESFVRLARSGKQFLDQNQVKTWLIVTAANLSKDLLRRRYRRELPLDSINVAAIPAREKPDLFPAVLALPQQYRVSIYLHYYEGYRVAEMAELMRKPQNTVKTWLRRGRKLLRDHLNEAG